MDADEARDYADQDPPSDMDMDDDAEMFEMFSQCLFQSGQCRRL